MPAMSSCFVAFIYLNSEKPCRVDSSGAQRRSNCWSSVSEVKPDLGLGGPFALILTHPWPGSSAMARGCSMPPAISVVRISPLSLATSIWSRLLSIQYSLSVIQSTARPSGVARPCCTTTSIPDTPGRKIINQLNELADTKPWWSFFTSKGRLILKEEESKKVYLSWSTFFCDPWAFWWVPPMRWKGATKEVIAEALQRGKSRKENPKTAAHRKRRERRALVILCSGAEFLFFSLGNWSYIFKERGYRLTESQTSECKDRRAERRLISRCFSFPLPLQQRMCRPARLAPP